MSLTLINTTIRFRYLDQIHVWDDILPLHRYHLTYPLENKEIKHDAVNKQIECFIKLAKEYNKFKDQERKLMIIKLVCCNSHLSCKSISSVNSIIEEQKQNELLLEEVLRSKTNIDGLIENKIRSFIYYGTRIV